MKLSKIGLSACATLAFSALTAGCGDDDPQAPGGSTGGSSSGDGGSNGDGDGGTTNGSGGDGGMASGTGGTLPDVEVEVSGDIDEDTTWTADTLWKLSGNVWVNEGATLTIEPGTIIQGVTSPSNPAVLVITRGAQINAVGEPDAPIVFTSAQSPGDRAPGDWGGVVLLGSATNNQGDEVQIEGLATTDTRKNHGGNDDSYSCGTMAYVRIEFAGIDLGNGDEVNGLTMGSCGSETDIHHVMVSNALDDGFEWFGGTMSAHHLVVNNAGDDMFDIDLGARIELDTIFGRQAWPQTSDPNGFEWDGNAGNFAAEPFTQVDVTKATLCGNAGSSVVPRYGMVLRRGITGSIDDAVVVGFSAGASLRDTPWDDDPASVTLTNGIFFETGDPNTHTSGTTVDAVAWFADGEGNAASSPGWNASNCRGAGSGNPPVAAVLGAEVGAFRDGSEWIQEPWVSWDED